MPLDQQQLPHCCLRRLKLLSQVQESRAGTGAMQALQSTGCAYIKQADRGTTQALPIVGCTYIMQADTGATQALPITGCTYMIQAGLGKSYRSQASTPKHCPTLWVRLHIASRSWMHPQPRRHSQALPPTPGAPACTKQVLGSSHTCSDQPVPQVLHINRHNSEF